MHRESALQKKKKFKNSDLNFGDQRTKQRKRQLKRRRAREQLISPCSCFTSRDKFVDAQRKLLPLLAEFVSRRTPSLREKKYIIKMLRRANLLRRTNVPPEALVPHPAGTDSDVRGLTMHLSRPHSKPQGASALVGGVWRTPRARTQAHARTPSRPPKHNHTHALKHLRVCVCVCTVLSLDHKSADNNRATAPFLCVCESFSLN